MISSARRSWRSLRQFVIDSNYRGIVLFRLRHSLLREPKYLFQPFNHTLQNRYPYLFQYARENLGHIADCRILSFGCSTGEEVFSLRDYFPLAYIKGVDINPRNIAKCKHRLASSSDDRIIFELTETQLAEPAGSYDAIFCMAVFTHGELARSAERCDHVIRFVDFESVMSDLERSLKVGGLLFLVQSSFRLRDTSLHRKFEVVLRSSGNSDPPVPIFDRNNHLLADAVHDEIAFRKIA